MTPALAVTYVYLGGFALTGMLILKSYRSKPKYPDEVNQLASVMIAFFWPVFLCALVALVLAVLVMIILDLIESFVRWVW